MFTFSVLYGWFDSVVFKTNQVKLSHKHTTQECNLIIHNLKIISSQVLHTSCLSTSVMGSCVAVTDYNPVAPDELQLSQGDTVKIEGLLIRGLAVFVATNTSTGLTGFVHKAHVKPLDTSPL